MTDSHIKSIAVQETVLAACALHQDAQQAIHELCLEAHFIPNNNTNAPYELEIDVQDNRLILTIIDNDNAPLPLLILSIKPYQRIIRDYFMMVESYQTALLEGPPSKIQAIDMGRRGIHNEGAELLQERLAEKIEIDTETARRLFTLICALHGTKGVRV